MSERRCDPWDEVMRDPARLLRAEKYKAEIKRYTSRRSTGAEGEGKKVVVVGGRKFMAD